MTTSDFKLWCRYVFTFLCLILFLNACEEAKKETKGLDEKSIQKHVVSYAKGFSIVYFDDFKIITIHSAWKGENDPIN